MNSSNYISFVLDLESEFKIPENIVFFYLASLQHNGTLLHRKEQRKHTIGSQ
jgi:hypothetical protein